MKLQLSLLFLSIIIFNSCSGDKIHIVKDDEGNIKEKITLTKDSVRNGLYQAYYEDGTLLEESTYQMGELHGTRKLYYSNGNVEIEENYDNGTMIGDYKVFHEGGGLELLQHFENGTLTGESLKYYEDGQLQEKVIFVDGEENGPFTEYFPNGKVQWEGEYLNGDNEVGLLKEYNESGELIKKMMCDSLSVCRTIWTLQDGDINLN